MIQIHNLSVDEINIIDKNIRSIWKNASNLNRVHEFSKTVPKYVCCGNYDWIWNKKGIYIPNIELPLTQELIDICLKYNLTPDILIINFYDKIRNKLNWHKDIDEKTNDKIISISLYGTCEFHYKFNNKKETLLLNHGDLLIFGEEHRYIEHCVVNKSDKRGNLTFRKY